MEAAVFIRPAPPPCEVEAMFENLPAWKAVKEGKLGFGGNGNPG